MTDDLPPFFNPESSQNSDDSETQKRPLTPAPSATKSQDSPAPLVVVKNQKSSIAIALFWGLVVGALVVGSMWYYQNRHTYFYEVKSNSSVLAKPRSVQEVLAKVEPATVAVSVDGGVNTGGSAGTGFIYSSDGVVVTNNHVVQGVKNKIEITLGDGRSFRATLLGRDPLEDLAVLKVDATGLPSAILGQSSKVKVGDDVIAIGNALALEGGLSVTRGIVSGLDRTIDTELNFQLQGIIQTDAAINRGNSGGPLVNSKGEVIGINTAIANPSYAQNIGFSIAIDRAKPIIDDLKKGKDRKIAFLGVAAQDVNDRLVKELDLKVSEGALIVEIQAGSPASKSDLALNDVITKIGDKTIKSANDMVSAIRTKQPGETVVVKYNRLGKEKTTKVTLTERPL
ncbi:MAG: trypsin-like peptidase domain-containing protein [Acidimicrobiia bacterium]